MCYVHEGWGKQGRLLLKKENPKCPARHVGFRYVVLWISALVFLDSEYVLVAFTTKQAIVFVFPLFLVSHVIWHRLSKSQQREHRIGCTFNWVTENSQETEQDAAFLIHNRMWKINQILQAVKYNAEKFWPMLFKKRNNNNNNEIQDIKSKLQCSGSP